VDRERSFFDTYYTQGGRPPEQSRFYYALQECRARYFELVEARAKGARFLDYCCGAGETAFAVSDRAAEVVGIDISEVAIAQAQARAERESRSNMSFRVMDAHATEFPDASFDVIAATGVIHHLDVGRAWREIARLLRPGGVGIFVEALGHDPLIAAYRAATPEARSPDQHSLLRGDFRIAEEVFDTVAYEFYGLATIASAFIQRTRMGPRAFRALRAVDRVLLATPGLRWNAWATLVQLGK
jgi:ubiquinone/menaquinone biosynthesis C-methylase UbiE